MHTYAFKRSCVNDSCNEPHMVEFWGVFLSLSLSNLKMHLYVWCTNTGTGSIIKVLRMKRFSCTPRSQVCVGET